MLTHTRLLSIFQFYSLVKTGKKDSMEAFTLNPLTVHLCPSRSSSESLPALGCDGFECAGSDALAIYRSDDSAIALYSVSRSFYSKDEEDDKGDGEGEGEGAIAGVTLSLRGEANCSPRPNLSAISSDRLAVHKDDGTFALYDVETMEESNSNTAVVRASCSMPPTCATLSATSNVLAVGAKGGKFFMYSSATGSLLKEGATPSANSLLNLMFDSTESILLASSSDTNVYLYDILLPECPLVYVVDYLGAIPTSIKSFNDHLYISAITGVVHVHDMKKKRSVHSFGQQTLDTSKKSYALQVFGDRYLAILFGDSLIVANIM